MCLQRLTNEIHIDCHIDHIINTHTKFGGNMYVLLRNPINRVMLEIVTWQFILQLAQDNGWEPRGIKPIDYFSSEITPMGTGYTPREAGLKCEIRNSDATGIGKATHRAMLKHGLIKPKKIKLRDDGVVTALDELIQIRNFIESGWFVVERVEDYDRKKHPKVMRRIDGLCFSELYPFRVIGNQISRL